MSRSSKALNTEIVMIDGRLYLVIYSQWGFSGRVVKIGHSR